MKDLIKRLKQKDEDAFREIMNMYKNRIFNYLKVMIDDRQRAEELTQETFVRVYFKAHSLRTEKIKSWIYAIATNLAKKEFRKRKIKKILSLSEVGENHNYINDNYEDKLLLKELFSDMPIKYKIPLFMKEFEGLSMDEISSSLKKPVGTVKSLIFRGKKMMENKYNEYMGG